MQTITVEKGITIIVNAGKIVNVCIPRSADLPIERFAISQIVFCDLPVTIIDISEGMC